MEGGSPVSPPPDVTPAASSGGASKFLASLPSRGFFSSTAITSNSLRALNTALLEIDEVIVLHNGVGLFSRYSGFSHDNQICGCKGGMRVYICDHDTSPPDNQLIKTNQTNILIRSLMLKNQRADSSSKDGKGTASNQGSRKRSADKTLDKAAGKKAMSSTQLGSYQGGGSSRLVDKDLQSFTVERLRAFLKERGLSVKGKKDELIARLRTEAKG